MRGKHRTWDGVMSYIDGSSPHARETLPHAAARQLRCRLIPACAGNTWPAPTRRTTRTAHPRMRGKHVVEYSQTPGRCGSSPHARETQRAADGFLVGIRLIPACAGNTAISSWSRAAASAHPRMRGKHRRLPNSGISMTGSSPHARETRDDGQHALFIRRLIPACAGNTSLRSTSRSASAAHPRMRGKHRTQCAVA